MLSWDMFFHESGSNRLMVIKRISTRRSCYTGIFEDYENDTLYLVQCVGVIKLVFVS